jgi:hypothetical protein
MKSKVVNLGCLICSSVTSSFINLSVQAEKPGGGEEGKKGEERKGSGDIIEGVKKILKLPFYIVLFSVSL